MHVEVNGGQRKPAEAPELAAWRLLHDAITGAGHTVVGVCDGCRQPLLSDQPGIAAIVWTIQTPRGPLQIDNAVRSPDGPMATEEADVLIQATYAERVQPGQAVFSGMLLTIMTLPLLLWLGAGFTFFSFLYLLYRGGMSVPN